MEAVKKKPGDMTWILWVLGGIVLTLVGLVVWIGWKLSRIQEAVERMGKKRGTGESPEDAVIDMAPVHSQEVPKTETALAVPASVPADSQPEPAFSYSEDSNMVTCGGEKHFLSPPQTQAFKNGLKLKEKGCVEFEEKVLLRDVGSANKKRLRDTFRSNLKAFYSIFTPGERRGTFRFKYS